MIVLVTGLPGTGKSRWVKQNMKPGDIVYDLDRLAGALTYSEEERENKAARYLANEMYDSFLSELEWEDIPLAGDVYIIRTWPGDREVDLLINASLKHDGAKVLVFGREYVDREFSRVFKAVMATDLQAFLESCQKVGIEVKRIE